jgi:anti-anti-sigma regulatory factor
VQDIILTAGQQLIIDLAGLTFCDSSGIATLITAYNKAAAEQWRSQWAPTSDDSRWAR